MPDNYPLFYHTLLPNSLDDRRFDLMDAALEFAGFSLGIIDQFQVAAVPEILSIERCQFKAVDQSCRGDHGVRHFQSMAEAIRLD